MAVTKQQMQNAINGYQKQGLGTRQIHIALAKRKDAIGESYRDDMQHGTPDEFNSVFGLKLSKGVTAGEVNKNASLADKAASYATSVGMGLADIGAGVIQGVAYAGDKVNEKLNKTFGTHLSTTAYKDYTASYEDANKAAEVGRRQAGRKGTDFVRTGTAIAATVPMFIAGDKTAAARGLGLLGRTAVQSGVGATVGAANYAKDGKERISNTAWGGVGGGAVIGKAVTKGRNAIKGNLKPEYQAVETLGKKFNVRTSAGDTMRKPIMKKGEKLAENAPVVGMAGFREAQHGEAKAAAGKVTNKLQDALNTTDFKALDTIRAKAASGDRNANRVMGIVNNADTPDKVIQASLEVRKFREESIASKLYDKAGKEIDKLPNKVVAPTKSTSLLGSKLDELSKSLAPDDILQKDLQKIQTAFNNPNVTTDFANMRLLRSQLGDMAEKYANTGTNPNKSGAKFLGDLRQAVTDDIDNFVATSGSPAVKQAYGRADGYYKGMMARQDKAYGKAMQSKTPDEIYNEFVKRGKGDRAANFYNALDQKGQAAVRLKMTDEAINKATNESTGHFSPAKFAGEFERLSEPYGKVFSGADKAEMDGFVKLMRHVESAGQYMENPPTGNRVAGLLMGGTAAVNLPLALKGAGATALFKTMVTTKAGKNLLMAASKLPEGSKGLANVLKAAETVMAASGAQAGISEPGPTDTQPTIEAQPIDTQPSIDAPVTQGGMPQLQVGDHIAPKPVDDPTMADMPQYDMGQSAPSMPSLPPVAPQGGFEPMPSDIAPIDSQKTTEPPQAQPTAINAVGQTLQSLIPPPKDTADPRKIATYEQVSQQAVIGVLNTPQMKQITTELESPQPSDSKIQSLQQSLAKTPEWQSFLQTLPKDQRQQLSGADVLSLITRNVSRNDNPVFNPQF